MKRVYYYDNIKGLLILLVVFYHIFNAFSSYYGYDASLFKLVGFVMMPIFIYTTGVSARLSKRSPKKRAFKILSIYLIFNTLTTLFYYFVLKTITIHDFFIHPRYTLWYLLTCFWLYLSEYGLIKINYKKAFFFSILITLFIGFVPFITDFLSLARTINFYPFFILGYYHKEFHIEDILSRYKYIIIFSALICILWFLFHQDYFYYSDTYMKYNYYTYSTPFLCFKKRCLLIPINIILSAFLLNIIPKSKNFLSNFGNKTIFIYLFHGIFIQTIQKYKIYLKHPSLQIIFVYILSIFFGYLIYFLFKKIKKSS